MGSVDDARRRHLRLAYKNAERAARGALMPISEQQLGSLIEFVDEHVVAEGCGHTIRFARRWAERHSVGWKPLAEGLEEFGGYCDCEIVMNCGPAEVFGPVAAGAEQDVV
ncbi:DUF2695 domain-containing protein [Micromonospora sp. NPDC049523]|uniref:DUF2695 domain-containing protein n=1 Tax=Micromonospora sp. NPDC049523 TaxID=3155921 RepID=UPI00343DF595